MNLSTANTRRRRRQTRAVAEVKFIRTAAAQFERAIKAAKERK